MVVHPIYYYLNVIHPNVILGIFLSMCCYYVFLVCALKPHDVTSGLCEVTMDSARYDRHR